MEPAAIAHRNELWRTTFEGLQSRYHQLAHLLRGMGKPWEIPEMSRSNPTLKDQMKAMKAAIAVMERVIQEGNERRSPLLDDVERRYQEARARAQGHSG
jgi:hypothetical protein